MTEFTQNHIDITLIIDRSFSMITLGKGVEASIIEFIETQKKNSVSENTYIHIVSFDDVKETVVENSLLKDLDISKIDYEKIDPRGATRLIDTVMEEIKNQENRVLGKDATCILAVVTDGDDNMSEKYSSMDLKERIKTCEKNSKFTAFFLASNQDAITSGDAIGFDKKRCITYGHTPENIQNTMRSLSAQVTTSSQGVEAEFTPLERQQSQGFDNVEENKPNQSPNVLSLMDAQNEPRQFRWI